MTRSGYPFQYTPSDDSDIDTSDISPEDFWAYVFSESPERDDTPERHVGAQFQEGDQKFTMFGL
jgi:hypothetical protein